MGLNLSVLIYGSITLILVTLCMQVVKWLIKNVFNKQMKKKDKKVVSTVINKLNLVVVVFGFLAIVILTVMNPLIRSSDQADVGSAVVAQEVIDFADVDMVEVDKKTTEIIEAKAQEIHTELNDVKQKSQDDYNKFMNSLKEQ